MERGTVESKQSDPSQTSNPGHSIQSLILTIRQIGLSHERIDTCKRKFITIMDIMVIVIHVDLIRNNNNIVIINLNSMFNYLRKIDGGRSISWGGDIV